MKRFRFFLSAIFILCATAYAEVPQHTRFQRRPLVVFTDSRRVLVETSRNNVFFHETCEVEPSVVKAGPEILQDFLNQTSVCQSLNSTYFEPTPVVRQELATLIAARVTDLLQKEVQTTARREGWLTGFMVGATAIYWIVQITGALKKAQSLTATEKVLGTLFTGATGYYGYWDYLRYTVNSPSLPSTDSPIYVDKFLPDWQLSADRVFRAFITAVDEVTTTVFLEQKI